VDLDGDGQADLLSGSWPGEVYFFKGNGSGRFAKGEQLKDRNGKPIKLGSASTVFASDWDGDGVLDLLIGDIDGHVWLVPNGGTTRKPAFGSPLKLEADGKVIKAPHGDSHPILADWDGDGIADLILGCGDGGVHWYRNIGTPKEPKLAAANVLVHESNFVKKFPPETSAKDQPCMRAKVCVVDWDGDGRLDLLIGDAGYTQQEAPKLTKEEAEAKKKAQEEYNKLCTKFQSLLEEQNKLFQVPPDEQPKAKAEREKKLQAVQEKLKPFNDEAQKLYPAMFKGQPKLEWHGHVWLYLRKAAKSE
jgi:predicted RNA-binding protein with RPS1 domain